MVCARSIHWGIQMTKMIIIAIIVLLVAAGLYLEFTRGNRLSATASSLGLGFKAGVQKIPQEIAAAKFDLLEQGDANLHNLMEGEYNGYPVAIFDYSYHASVSGEGFGSKAVEDDQMGVENRSQSVVWWRTAKSLPMFDVSPAKGHMRTTAARFGLTALGFDNDSFSETTTLLVRDTEAGRALFQQPLRDMIQDSGLVIESRGDALLFYRFEQRLKANQLEGFLAEVETIAKAIEAAVP